MATAKPLPSMTYDVPDEAPSDEGVVIVNAPGAFSQPAPENPDNLAAHLTDLERLSLGQQLLGEIDDAAASMEPWREITAKGLREMGVDRTRANTKSTPVPGASNAVFPLLAQASVNFASRAMQELCPPSGPCDAVVIGAGKDDEAEQDRAERIKDFQNFQLLNLIEEWADEHDKLLAMLPIEGSSFKKVWWDQSRQRICSAYVPSEHVIMPYHAGNVDVSPLVANVIDQRDHEIKANIASGLWLEHARQANRPGSSSDSALGEARDKVIGDAEAAVDQEETREYRYYETAIRRHLPELVGKVKGAPAFFDGDEAAEWLVTIADGSGEVVAIYPNWRTSAQTMTRRRRLVEYRMFPWAGSRGVGLFHLIGGLNSAATSALRAVFDAAMRASFPGGWVLKGSSRDRGDMVRGYGEYKELSGSVMTTDIRQILMEDQFAGPHPVLSQLLEFLANAGMQFASVALQELGNATSTTPVGTTLARFEEGSKPFAAIFQRLHRSQAREFAEIYEINRETISDEWLAARFNNPDIRAADFTGDISVIPISDPKSFSQLQRTLRAELMLQVGGQLAQLGVQVDMNVLAKEAWAAAALPMGDEVFPGEPEPFTNPNPFVENAAAARGSPLDVGEQDDHRIHLAAHLALLSIPTVATTPTGAGLAVHILDHAAVAATEGGGIEVYIATIDMMAKLIEPPDQDGVRAIAEAEMAKVDAKLVELKGREELEAKRVEFEREKIAFEFQQQFALEQEKHRIELIEIEKRFELEFKKLDAGLRETREKIASTERIKSAEIAAREPVEVEREAEPAGKGESDD